MLSIFQFLQKDSTAEATKAFEENRAREINLRLPAGDDQRHPHQDGGEHREAEA